MPRKYKPVSKCPEELQNIIALVNLLPANAEALFDDQFEGAGRSVWRKDDGTILHDSARELFDKKIVEYVFDRKPDTQAVERSENLLKAKNLFHHFAAANRKYPRWNGAEADREKQYKFLLDFFTVDYKSRQFSIFISVSNEGFIKPIKDELSLIEIFEKYNIPLQRILSCKICSQIFWAKKANAETCGNKKCSDALGNQKRSEEAKTRKEKQANHFQSRIKK